jgi:hypothetical protein
MHGVTPPFSPTAGRVRTMLRAFMTNEASGGIVLMAAAVLALLVANSALAPAYFGFLKTSVAGLSVLHWINDALMAVFFLLVGLEIKREMLDGHLSTWSRRALPGIAAAGGMIVPALIYVGLNAGTPDALRGWAIPSATDIAFALGVLALLGSRVPVSLKVLLTALAILDDLGAVAIIAVFYTAELSLPMLGLSALTFVGLAILSTNGVQRLLPYLALGVVLWFFVLRSGVHATLAGVALAATIPLRCIRPGPRRPSLPDPPGARSAALGGVCHRADLRACQCRRVVRGNESGDTAVAGSARHRARSVCRQAGGGVRLRLGGDSDEAGGCAGERELVAALRRGDPLRHRVHDEPVHRPDCLPDLARAAGCGQDWRAGRIGGVSACRCSSPSIGESGAGAYASSHLMARA